MAPNTAPHFLLSLGLSPGIQTFLHIACSPGNMTIVSHQNLMWGSRGTTAGSLAVKTLCREAPQSEELGLLVPSTIHSIIPAIGKYEPYPLGNTKENENA